MGFIRDTRVQIAGGVVSFKDDAERIAGRPVHFDIVPAVDARSGRQLHKTQRIANGSGADGEVEGQSIDPVSADGVTLRGVFRLEQWSIRGHGHGLGRGPDFEPYIHALGLGYLYLDSPLKMLLEAGHLHGNIVETYREGRDGVVAGGCGHGPRLHTRFRVHRDDDGIRNHRSRRIRHGSGDRSAVALGEHGSSAKQRNNRKTAWSLHSILLTLYDSFLRFGTNMRTHADPLHLRSTLSRRKRLRNVQSSV